MQAPRSCRGLFVALTLGAREALAGGTGSNPLGKVLDLMSELSAKITREGEEEAQAYKKFSEWCDSRAKNVNFEIKTLTSQKDGLQAKIGQLSGAIDVNNGKIDELAGEIAASNGDLSSATTIRTKEASDFASSEKELMEVIDTLGRAIDVLERDMQKNPASFAQTGSEGAKSVLQTLSVLVDAAGLSVADHQRLTALLQSRQGSESDDDEFGAPAAAVYKTHSTNIFDVLEDLKEKAETQLSDLRKAEVNAKHNYEMLKQSLEDQAAADTKDMEAAKARKAAAAEGKAEAEGDLERTVMGLSNAEKTLETATTNCMQTAADHAATVKARDEELKVIAEATQILQETSSGAVSQTYSLLQEASATGVSARIRTRVDLKGSEVAAMVKRLAKQHHSAALAQLASRISAVMRFGAAGGQDPFGKVKGLIQNLIEKLEAEASSEATEKAYCDEETAKTEARRDELSDDVSKLSAKLDQAGARSAQLKEEVRELQEELATISKEQSDMDAMRRDSHSDFVQAKADLELGLEGVRKAIGVLREYYGAGAASMMQSSFTAMMQQPAIPETHTKAGGAGSSIIGILEVVESDFASGLAKEETEEDDAQAEYDKTTQENTVTKTMKDQDVSYKSLEIRQLAKTMAELSSDRDTTSTELIAVMEYHGQLQQRCVAKPQTYEERKQRREAEIAGLREALRVLEDETALVQRKHRGVHMRGSLLPR